MIKYYVSISRSKWYCKSVKQNHKQGGIIRSGKGKEPIVSNGAQPYIQKLVLHVHKTNGHQGTESVIIYLRRTFWIPHIRSSVKPIIRQFGHCRPLITRPLKPKMALVPEERLLKHEKPVSITSPHSLQRQEGEPRNGSEYSHRFINKGDSCGDGTYQQ